MRERKEGVCVCARVCGGVCIEGKRVDAEEVGHDVVVS